MSDSLTAEQQYAIETATWQLKAAYQISTRMIGTLKSESALDAAFINATAYLIGQNYQHAISELKKTAVLQDGVEQQTTNDKAILNEFRNK